MPEHETPLNNSQSIVRQPDAWVTDWYLPPEEDPPCAGAVLAQPRPKSPPPCATFLPTPSA
jgi:hypothetical protein